MMNFYTKFKIPTLLGLAVILVGIAIGVFLVLREQTFISGATEDVEITGDVTFSNMSDDSVAISWQTNKPVAQFITFGQNNVNEHVVLDDKDSKSPQSYTTHHFTLKNLLPKTIYQFKIVPDKNPSIRTFETVSVPTTQTGFTPVIGNVLDNDMPLKEGIAYLSIAGADIQSSPIKSSGTFLIPISKMRKSDFSDIYPLADGTIAKLTIVSDKEQAQILFRLKSSSNTLPPLRAGETLDLTENLTQQPIVYDLNGDGCINAADHAIILENFGDNPADARADLNKDGVVDDKDLELISLQINPCSAPESINQ